jgi:hypothetical protein
LNSLACLVNSSRLRVVVYPRVSSKFIRSRKSFCAARVLACMRLLSSMCSDMSCLMFETMKSFIAQRILVWSWEALLVVVSVLAIDGHHFCSFVVVKLPVLAPSLSDARRCSEVDGEDVLKGFAERSTLATGAERTEGSGMHTGEVRSRSGIIRANIIEGFRWNFFDVRNFVVLVPSLIAS